MRAFRALIRKFATKPAQPVGITQADLDAITDSCGAPRDWLILKDNEVVLRASPDEDEVTLTCVLRKMSAILAAHNAGPSGTAQASEEK